MANVSMTAWFRLQNLFLALCVKALRAARGGFISPNLAVEHMVCENAKRL